MLVACRLARAGIKTVVPLPDGVVERVKVVLPAGAVVTADDSKRTLIVQGASTELQLAQDTVRIFDVDQMSGMSMALVPLRNADPPAMAEELKNLFAATKKEADSDAIRFMPVRRLNAVMVISRSGRYLDEARAWIGRLDRTRGKANWGAVASVCGRRRAGCNRDTDRTERDGVRETIGVARTRKRCARP